MDKNLSEIIVITDRSSSMSVVRDEAIKGFNGFLKEQQDADLGKCLLTYCQFNTEYEIVHNGIPIEEMKPLDERTYVPQGMTALLDAVGRTIDAVGARLAKTPESKRPGSVTVVILTDGEENSSEEYDLDKVRKLIEHQADVYKWTFIFLGKGLDAFHGGQRFLNADHSNVFVGQVADNPDGQQHAYFTASAAVLGNRRKALRGIQASFSVAEKSAYTSALGGDHSDADAISNDSSTGE